MPTPLESDLPDPLLSDPKIQAESPQREIIATLESLTEKWRLDEESELGGFSGSVSPQPETESLLSQTLEAEANRTLAQMLAPDSVHKIQSIIVTLSPFLTISMAPLRAE
jgi:hypothetical protein